MKALKFLFLGLMAIVVSFVIVWFLAFPRDLFVSIPRPDGGMVTFSRGSVSFDPPPNHYATNGFDHIEPHVSRFLVPSERFKSLDLITPDGERGFSLHASDGQVQAVLTVEWRKEGERETATRQFFSSLGIAPSDDYLAGNGNIPDGTRILQYPINGNAAEITALTKRILEELCGVGPTEALDISYGEH